jgi:putative transposase
VDAVIDTLNSERFCDKAPAQVWATLLDEGTYLASVSTMYRLLRERSLVRERRVQARRPALVKPELVATAPNQVWSWDITKLAGPYKWTWFQLYTIIDVYSRYVVGWQVAPRESATLAEQLIAHAIYDNEVLAGQLTLHADRGSSMTSRTVSQLLCDLGVLQSHSRPHVSNDNPYSESQFKTLKYFPTFPKRFADIAAARSFCGDSSSTTTTSIGTRASLSILQPTSTSDWPRSSAKSARSSSTPPTSPCLSGSGPRLKHLASLTHSGLTDPRRCPWSPNRSELPVSHFC